MAITHRLLPRPRSLATAHPALFTSIRFRLTMWYVLILALVLGVFSVLVYVSQAQSISVKMNEQLRTDGQLLASAYNPLDGTVHIPDPVKPFSEKTGLRENDMLLVLDGKNNLVQQVGLIGANDSTRLLKMAQVVNAGGSQGPGVGASDGTSDIDNIRKKLEYTNQSGTTLDPKQVAALMAGLTHTSNDFFTFSFDDNQSGA